MQVIKKSTYKAPRYLEQAKQILELLTDGQRRHYHVRDNYSVHRKGTWERIPQSYAENTWLPARYLRDRLPSEPDIPRLVEEKRFLSAHVVARHLSGKNGWVGASPSSWASWFAFDIDLAKGDAAQMPLEEAEARRDEILGDVWAAFEFGPGRMPVVLLTPGGGYHVYVPLCRDEVSEGANNSWPAHVIRERVIARLNEAGLKLRDGELELWPSGKILRYPMGRRMCLLEAQNPGDAYALGLIPKHAKWISAQDKETGAITRKIKREVGPGAECFISDFQAARKPLSEWLLDDEAAWSKKYGPFGDLDSSKFQKKSTLTSQWRNVSQQYVEVNSSGGMSDDQILKGADFLNYISKLQRTGLTVSGGRHNAALKLTYYFGVCLGLGFEDSMAALSDWLCEFDHVSSYRAQYGQEKFLKQTLAEARHYYACHVAKINASSKLGGQNSEKRRGFQRGLPLGEDLNVFEGKFSSEAVEEAALCMLRVLKGYSDAKGVVAEPTEFTGSFLKRLCGERRVQFLGAGGEKKRIRATQLAVEELISLGILTVYKNYRVNNHGRYFSCWYKFGSGELPKKAANGNYVLSTVRVEEGTLEIRSTGNGLAVATTKLFHSVDADGSSEWVERMYKRHNFAPGDLEGDLSRHIGSFRDYKATKKDLEDAGKTLEREFGVVSKFDEVSGYGFVASDFGGKELFVHQTNICADGFRELVVGERVEFTRSDGEKGPKAIWVKRLDVSSGSPAPSEESSLKKEAPQNDWWERMGVDRETFEHKDVPPALPVAAEAFRPKPVPANSNNDDDAFKKRLHALFEEYGDKLDWSNWQKYRDWEGEKDDDSS